jgi:hypothetical protein
MSKRKKLKAKCFDPSFVYVPSGSTDLRATFARIRAERARVAEACHHATAIVPIKKVG